jgi:hypothetical protein
MQLYLSKCLETRHLSTFLAMSSDCRENRQAGKRIAQYAVIPNVYRMGANCNLEVSLKIY